ncbi:xylulokinase [Meiothermus sp. CFH 77666]|uniref:xylulokinase n=1 Tax=Meiothermus sp. CFH 77666 TaxID=2817942 RepID=UPI001AA07AEA|nr:xylulokinase [Meiothermus sp. CFH 77666]MBO1436149.1 xylulokinase [Meiothermus sp. CFH 77666]
MRLVLGLDLGTSGLKAVALDEQGQKVAEARAVYPLHTPRPGWTEQDPLDWARAAQEALKALRGQLGQAEMVGLGLSGQMHGAVFLDKAGAPLAPAPLWNDQRTAREVAEIEAAIPCEELIRRTGNPAVTGFQLPKLLWLRNQHPELFRRVYKVLLPKDYLAHALTGAWASEYSDASGVGALNLATRRWDPEILQSLGLSEGLFPELGPSERVVGTLSPAWAQATGLPAGLPVVAGAGDNAAAALGLGVSRYRKGVGSVSLGTSGVIFLPLEEPTPEPQGRVHLFAHADGGYHLLGVTLSAAGSLEWLRGLFPEVGLEALLKEAEQVPLGSEGLYFLPFLAGERSPYLNPYLRGAFLGLSLAHKRGHLVRSVLEGVALSLGEVYQVMRPLAEAQRLLATGGGAASDLWLSLLSGALGMPVVRVTGDEGAARGAGILALVGAGVYEGLREALQATAPAELAVPGAQAEISGLQPGYVQAVEMLLRRYSQQ